MENKTVMNAVFSAPDSMGNVRRNDDHQALLDDFAKAAMQGMATNGTFGTYDNDEISAHRCYDIAEAMLREREGRMKGVSQATREYSDQQNAELREQLDSETESRKYWQRQAQRYQKYHRGLKAALERVKELESQNDRYRKDLEDAIIRLEEDKRFNALSIAKEALKQQ